VPAPPDPELQRLQEEVRSLRAERDRLDATLADISLRCAEAEARADQESALLAILDAHRSPDSHVEATPTRLLDLLHARGLRGPDESRAALAALLDGHALTSVLPLLSVEHPARLRFAFEERLVLSCGLDGCVPPEGCAVTRVHAERCDLCWGESLPRIARRFSDACLLAGITKILLVGGPGVLHRSIREGLDRRILLTSLSGPAPNPERVQEALGRVQLALGWDRGSDPGLLGERVRQDRVPYFLVDHRSAGSLLEASTRWLEALDASAFPFAGS
jgi:hypothetical protein